MISPQPVPAVCTRNLTATSPSRARDRPSRPLYQGRVLHAHRIVLLCSRASDVFRAMLRHPMTEASTAVVEVVDVQYEVMHLLLEYLYMGAVEVPLSLAPQLLLAAERYMVYPLQLDCVAVLQAGLCAETIWTTFALADSLHMPPPLPPEPGAPPAASPAELLRDACAGFLLQSEQLEQLLASDDFHVNGHDLIPRLERRLVARLATAQGEGVKAL